VKIQSTGNLLSQRWCRSVWWFRSVWIWIIWRRPRTSSSSY